MIFTVKKSHFVIFFLTLVFLKNGYSETEDPSSNPNPAVIIKQLEFDSDIKIEQFTSLFDSNRIKDGAGHVIQAKQESMNESTAKKILKNRLIQLKLLFAPQTAAYSGMLTKDYNCQKSAVFAKKINDTSKSLFWYSEMPGSDDFTYGACGNRKEPYWSQYLLIYCKKQNTLFDIRYFQLRTDKETKLGRAIAKCRI